MFRDNYDKEVKAIKDNQTVSIGAVSQQSQTGCKQHKKPDRETYLPPTRRKPPGDYFSQIHYFMK